MFVYGSVWYIDGGVCWSPVPNWNVLLVRCVCVCVCVCV